MSSIEIPDAIFWDWDGTLADSYNLLNQAHNHTRLALGLEPMAEGEYQNYFGKPRDILYPLLYQDKVEEAKTIFSAYVIENSHKINIIDGAADALQFLHDRGVTMGIVSNKRADLINEELKHLQWEHFFSDVTGAGDAEQDKPSGAPLYLALERTNIDHTSQNVWFVGDTENDLACADEVGCASLLMQGHDDMAPLIARYKPILSYSTYTEFMEFLVAIYKDYSKTKVKA